METPKFVFFFVFFSFFLFSLVNSLTHHNHHINRHDLDGFRPSKLFVFGDSYVDTGNIKKFESSSWKFPYGITFPGRPVGRFSDGRVFTDYLAKYMGIKSPIPYKWRKYAGNRLRFGMNFAYGGTGVFNTLVPLPNMTTQIDFFQRLITEKVYTLSDLQSSVVLVTLAGNDYGAFTAKNSSAEALISFIPLVVNQLVTNLKRLRQMGAKKIAVTTLEPLGCLPTSTFASSFQSCNETQNAAVSYHNLLLQEALSKLNNATKNSTYVTLDLYGSFMLVFKNKGHPLGISKFGNPLKPCCLGISQEYSCGSVDEKGVKKYTVCNNPQSTFFWDTVHPTQEGWHAVYSALQATLQQIYQS